MKTALLMNTGNGHALLIDDMQFRETRNPELLGAIAWAFGVESVFEGPLSAFRDSAHFCWFAWSWANQLYLHSMGVRLMPADILGRTFADILLLASSDEDRALLGQTFSLKLHERLLLMAA
jgi:hypothetical protein